MAEKQNKLNKIKHLREAGKTFANMLLTETNTNHGGVQYSSKKIDSYNPNQKIHYNMIKYSDACFRRMDKHSNLVIVHGAFEHSARYNFQAYMFAQKGFIVHSFDFRGLGKSDGSKFDTEHLEDFHQDIATCLKQINNKLPTFILAHSMGGGLILHFQLRNPTQLSEKLIDGVMLSGPLSGFDLSKEGLHKEFDQWLIPFLGFLLGNNKWRVVAAAFPGNCTNDLDTRADLYKDALYQHKKALKKLDLKFVFILIKIFN